MRGALLLYQLSLDLMPFQTILHNMCEVAPDYDQKLRELTDPEKMQQADRIVQFPFIAPVRLFTLTVAETRSTRDVTERDRKN
jgi:hypothetical protein